jgi:hypothetical protein
MNLENYYNESVHSFNSSCNLRSIIEGKETKLAGLVMCIAEIPVAQHH